MNKYNHYTPAAEIRIAPDNPRILLGRPVVYNSWSEPIGGQFREMLLPGCFDASLATGRDIIATIDHNPALILGRTESGTLTLGKDDRGIYCKVEAPDTSYGRDLLISVSRGDIRGMSFIFDVEQDTWGSENGERTRKVSKASLYEVSYVTFPSYPATEVALRQLQRDLHNTADLRRALRLREAELDIRTKDDSGHEHAKDGKFAATSAAGSATEKAHKLTVESGHKGAYGHSKQAESNDIKAHHHAKSGDSDKASNTHHAAAAFHEEAAKKHMKKGLFGVSKKNKAAAEAHLAAAKAHKAAAHAHG